MEIKSWNLGHTLQWLVALEVTLQVNAPHPVIGTNAHADPWLLSRQVWGLARLKLVEVNQQRDRGVRTKRIAVSVHF